MPSFTIEEVLRRYPQRLHTNLEEVAANEIGLTNSLIQMNLPPNKIGEDYEIDHGNSVILDIPYAGKYLQWEIIFNDEDLTFAPDFDIFNDAFLSDPSLDLIENNLSTLSDWNVENPASLMNFVRQLFELYKTYQMDKFLNDTKYDPLSSEFEQLKTQLMLSNNDVEIYTDDNGQHILISLKLDYSGLPVYIQKTYFPDGILMNPGSDLATLKISFYQHRKIPKLQLSPRLENVLGLHSSLYIPPYKNTTSMVDYVQLVIELLKEKIDDIKMHFKKKESYIAVLLSLHGDNIREYDNIGFTKATFLFEAGSFACLAQICLGDRFPNEVPLVTLRSMYHKNANGMPASSILKSYPYNAGWEVEEMVDKLLLHIRREMPKFKSHCLNNL